MPKKSPAKKGGPPQKSEAQKLKEEVTKRIDDKYFEQYIKKDAPLDLLDEEDINYNRFKARRESLLKRSNVAAKDAMRDRANATSPEAVGEDLVRSLKGESEAAARRVSMTAKPVISDMTGEAFTINRYISDENITRIGKLKNIL